MTGEATAGTHALWTSRGTFGVRSAGPPDGVPVLLLHGFPDVAETFTGLQAALAAVGRRSVALTLRGYAPSPLVGPYGLADVAADVAGVVEALGSGPVDLVGHDFGGQVAWAVLQRSPGLVRRAVVLAAPHPASIAANARRSPAQWWRSRYIVGFQVPGLAEWRVRRHDFRYVERLWQRWSGPGWQARPDHLRRVREVLRDSMPAPVAMYRAGGFALPRTPVDVPVLSVLGRADGCVLPAMADGERGLVTAEHRSVVLDEVGHWPHLEAPGDVAELVLAWLGQPG